jgi:hypothetical protein
VSPCYTPLTLAPSPSPFSARLLDCVQSEGRLYLVFEFVDRDLKKYMEAQPDMLPRAQVKVRHVCFIHLRA